MKALSNSFRIRNYGSEPSTGLNNQYRIKGAQTLVVDDQSTLLREYGYLSYVNRLEIQKLKSYSQLEDNWDSYGAQKITEDIINQAIDLVGAIDKLDEEVYFSSPGPNGEILIQIKKGEKEAELLLYRESSKYVTFDNAEFAKQGEFKTHILPEIIEWLNL